MSGELANAYKQLQNETIGLLEAVFSKDTKHAESQAITIVNLIHHIKRIEQRQ